jgi:hypothetical protein
MTRQLDMYDNADPLIGNEVNLPGQCQCGHDMLHVGAGRSPHRSSLRRSGPTTTLTPL